MPIPEDLVKCQLTFDLGPGVDIAVFGFHLHRLHTAGNPTNWPADVQVVADKVRDAWAEEVDSTAWPVSCVAQDVAVYHLDTAGHALDKGQAVFSGASAWSGGQSASLPWEVAMCVTLDCYDVDVYTPNRARKRGRFYLPAPGLNATNGPSGAIDGGLSSMIRDGVGAFIDRIALFPLATLPGDSFEMGVLSRAASAFYPLQRVRMDDQFDVQKRRQNKQEPVYTTLWTAP